MSEKNLEVSSDTPNKVTAEEKIERKRSIPAQIVFWVFTLFALYVFYRALSGHPSH